MEGSAPKEKGRGTLVEEPARIVHIPTQERMWRAGVVQHTQQIAPSHTTEQATPPAAHPIPDSDVLKQVKAERVDAEPDTKLADITHTLGSTIQEVVSGPSDTRIRTTEGKLPISIAVRKLIQKGKGLFKKRAA